MTDTNTSNRPAYRLYSVSVDHCQSEYPDDP